MKLSTPLPLVLLALTACGESTGERISIAIDYKLGVVTRTDNFEVKLRAKNSTPHASTFDGYATSSGCIGVIDYSERVEPGEDAVVTMEVRPIDRFGKQNQQLRITSPDGGFIVWHVDAIFAARPFFQDKHREVSVGPSALHFETTLSLRALDREGAPSIASEIDGLSISIERQAEKRKSQVLTEWLVRVRGDISPEDMSARHEIELRFDGEQNSARPRATLDVVRRSSIVASPRAVLVPRGTVDRHLSIAYGLEKGLKLEKVELCETLAGHCDVEANSGEIRLRVGASLPQTATGALTLRASNGDRRVVPVLLIESSDED